MDKEGLAPIHPPQYNSTRPPPEQVMWSGVGGKRRKFRNALSLITVPTEVEEAVAVAHRKKERDVEVDGVE